MILMRLERHDVELCREERHGTNYKKCQESRWLLNAHTDFISEARRITEENLLPWTALLKKKKRERRGKTNPRDRINSNLDAIKQIARSGKTRLWMPLEMDKPSGALKTRIINFSLRRRRG